MSEIRRARARDRDREGTEVGGRRSEVRREKTEDGGPGDDWMIWMNGWMDDGQEAEVDKRQRAEVGGQRSEGGKRWRSGRDRGRRVDFDDDLGYRTEEEYVEGKGPFKVIRITIVRSKNYSQR